MEVRIENLTKTFPGRKKNEPGVTAVDTMNLIIPDGKLIGLLGPSGCGKSTTLYMIAGLHKPTAGKIFFGDDEVTHLPPENRGIGLVFQNYALYPHFTVGKNIRFPLDNIVRSEGQIRAIKEMIAQEDAELIEKWEKDEAVRVAKYENEHPGEEVPPSEIPRPVQREVEIKKKLTKEEKNVIVHEMARLVDIEAYLERKPKELSGGQQQRVAIARALAKRPRVLLLDEPLSNLDARLRLQTREEIKRIQRETNITTIFVTHDQEEAMSISDYIVVMDFGVIQQIGEPQNVYEEPVNLFVAKFLGSPAINTMEGEIKKGKLYINGVLISDAPAYKTPQRIVTIREEKVTEEVDVIVPLNERGEPISHAKEKAAAIEVIEEYQALVEGELEKEAPQIPYYVDKDGSIIPLDAQGEPVAGEAKEKLVALIKEYLEFVEAKGKLAPPTTPYRVEKQMVEKIEQIEEIEEVYDRKVVVGVRPEAFLYEAKGLIQVELNYVEHIGRDISCVGLFVDGAEEPSPAKIIIPAEYRHDVKGKVIRFNMKKYYVFELSGERVDNR